MKKTIHVKNLLQEVETLNQVMQRIDHARYSTSIDMLEHYYNKANNIVSLMQDFNLISYKCSNTLIDINIYNKVKMLNKFETKKREGGFQDE